MNEIEILQRLGHLARDEAEPSIDISGRVCQRLRTGKPPLVDRNLAVASLGACCLAAIALVATLSWTPAADSVAALSQLVTSGGDPEMLLRLLEP